MKFLIVVIGVSNLIYDEIRVSEVIKESLESLDALYVLELF